MTNKFLPLLFFLALMTTGIETDISLASFPQISKHFHVSEGMVQLTIAYNFLGFCIGGFIYGPLSDNYGRRKIMIVGNAIMLVGALGCIYAPSIYFLLTLRFIQGIGASTSVVLVFAMIADLYSQDKAVKLIGMMNACLSSAMAIAPLAGGFINHVFAWRGNYSFVGFLCFLNLTLIVLFLPETKKGFENKINFIQIAKNYKILLWSPRFISASFVPSILFSAYMSYIATSSFLYMDTFSLSAIAFVIHQTVIISSFAITSLLADRLMKRIGAWNIVKVGISVCVFASLLLVVISIYKQKSAYIITSFISLFCVGFAACYPVIFSESLSIFPNIRGTASSFNMSSRAFLVFSFTGLSSFIYNKKPIMVSLILFLGAGLSSLFFLWLLYLKKKEYKQNRIF